MANCGDGEQCSAGFHDDEGGPLKALLLSRHYFARAVNAARHDSTAWRMWAELEREHGDSRLAGTFNSRATLEENIAYEKLKTEPARNSPYQKLISESGGEDAYDGDNIYTFPETDGHFPGYMGRGNKRR